jgi:hypothetical protein
VAVHWNTFGNLRGIFARMTSFSSRLDLEQPVRLDIGEELICEVQRGLRSRSRSLAARSFYDDGGSLSNPPTPLCRSSRATMNRAKKPSLLDVRHEFVTISSRVLLLLGGHPAKPEPFISAVHTRIEPLFYGMSVAGGTAFRGTQKLVRRSREDLLRHGHAIVIGRVRAVVEQRRHCSIGKALTDKSSSNTSIPESEERSL